MEQIPREELFTFWSFHKERIIQEFNDNDIKFELAFTSSSCCGFRIRDPKDQLLLNLKYRRYD